MINVFGVTTALLWLALLITFFWMREERKHIEFLRRSIDSWHELCVDLLNIPEREFVKKAVRILCKAGVMGDADTLNAIDKWMEEQ